MIEIRKIKKKRKKMINKLFKIIMISTISTVTSFASLHAEKVDCDLLSPMQKKIYQAYCKSVSAESKNSKGETIAKTKSSLKKGLGKLNTDSKLMDWIKGNKK